jgi:signal transduction histidine kinase
MKKNKLLKLTIILLITISVLVISALLLFIHLLQHQRDDSEIINVAGKQRMLCQRISKTCILLTYSSDSSKKIDYLDLLKSSLADLKTNNSLLIGLENTVQVKSLLDDAQTYYVKIIENAEKFTGSDINDRANYISTMLQNEFSFFKLMDKTVDQYEKENQEKIEMFKYYIIFSNIAIVIILFSLVAFVINPAINENEKNYEIIRKNNDELSNLNATKNKLFSIIAHDLRNPFNYILGFLEFMLSNIHNQKVEDIEANLNNIRIQSENTYQLLENLLDWAKTQTGQISFNPEIIDIYKVIDETLLVLKTLADNKNISIEVALLEELPIYADRDMLKTILRNLVTNAIKYSNKNSIVSISSELFRNYIEFTVTDTGIGMSEEEIKVLFHQEIQRSKEGTAKEKGTGLGLILCKEFIERHEGKIWVESEVNKGSKFKFLIPVQESDTR